MKFARATFSIAFAALVMSLGVAALVVAGPLNPPAGAVAPTYKTLTEVEPRTAINATNTPGDDDPVSRSLFKITQPGSYYLTGNITGVTGRHGIEVVSGGVTIDLNGFSLTGVPGSLSGVVTTFAGLKNIAVINGTVRNWGRAGVDLRDYEAINCRIEGVLASDNGFGGLGAGRNGVITDCAAANNSSIGIFAGTGTTIAHCSATGNAGTGISVVVDCTVAHCTSSRNAGAGIGATGAGNAVIDCTVSENVLDGITFCSGCTIRGNTCSDNGAASSAAIHATGGENRIDGNNCTGSFRGIDVDAPGNIIVRNTCSANTTNWDVVAGNRLLVVNSPAAAAVTGNSGGTSLGSFDPNANFSY